MDQSRTYRVRVMGADGAPETIEVIAGSPEQAAENARRAGRVVLDVADPATAEPPAMGIEQRLERIETLVRAIHNNPRRPLSWLQTVSAVVAGIIAVILLGLCLQIAFSSMISMR